MRASQRQTFHGMLAAAALTLGVSIHPIVASAQQALANTPQTLRPILEGVTFDELDKDSNQRVSRGEFVDQQGDRKLLLRDFLLLDSNRDDQLSAREFEARAPDPFSEILSRAIDAMDDSYDGWLFRGDERVDTTTFAINYATSLSRDGRRRLDRDLIAQVDPNKDRQVTRDEAIRFLEIQLGIRWTTGDLLRQSDGRVINFAEFLRIDTDQNDRLDKDEFVDNWWGGGSAEQDFEQLDSDQDQQITLKEYCQSIGPNVINVLEWFRKDDTNLDASLDAGELEVAIPKRRENLIRSSLSAFDSDSNGKLSLAEFQTSMLGNHNYPWENLPKDEDRDEFLSLDEFRFDRRKHFLLQRWYYFHRLDQNRDGRLSTDEFTFRLNKLHSLHRVSIDGERSRQLYKHKNYPVVASPDVSPDGEWVLFDATPPEGPNRAQILLMKSNGEDAREICDGLMPSWSSDGQRFACSRYEGGSSVWIMNLDGTADQRIDDGWGAQWSPDGKAIAYTNDNSIRVHDVETGKSREVLAKRSHPYIYIYWNMSWSPDSRRIVFRGKRIDKEEIAIINMNGEPALKRCFSTTEQLASDLAWSPDGRRILFDMHSRDHHRNLIFQLDLQADTLIPKIVPEASTSKTWTSVCFSPDGDWMILASAN